VRACDFSVKIIVESLEQTLSQVHITNGINTVLEGHRSRELAITMAPEVLNTLHVPLVHNGYDFLTLTLINVFEEVFISLIYEDFLQAREENIKVLNVPID
jgi:hypothetical protein